uniref:Junctophilin n=1 Tax=Eptatretus burgeri TaxID=7764 RepID=A0A8C4R5Y1_EPTBU
MSRGRFDFEDGGAYCGGWTGGKAHGYGVCTGPEGRGQFAGSWERGLEISGVYIWPEGITYAGGWMGGQRQGLGVETTQQQERRSYRGEWTHGFKGRYGVREAAPGQPNYEGCWTDGLPDGCGVERYPDGGTYEGQWSSGARQGLGVRRGSQRNTQPGRGSFRRFPVHARGSKASTSSDGASSLAELDADAAEWEDSMSSDMYAGEWMRDQRSGLGVCVRLDGAQFEGEWRGNRRHGYGQTTYPDGRSEEGKYRQGVLLAWKKAGTLPGAASKRKARLEAAVLGARRMVELARQKAEMAKDRAKNAQERADDANVAAEAARAEARTAIALAMEISPTFLQPETETEESENSSDWDYEEDEEVVSEVLERTPSIDLYKKGTTPPPEEIEDGASQDSPQTGGRKRRPTLSDIGADNSKALTEASAATEEQNDVEKPQANTQIAMKPQRKHRGPPTPYKKEMRPLRRRENISISNRVKEEFMADYHGYTIRTRQGLIQYNTNVHCPCSTSKIKATPSSMGDDSSQLTNARSVGMNEDEKKVDNNSFEDVEGEFVNSSGEMVEGTDVETTQKYVKVSTKCENCTNAALTRW